MRLVSKPAPLQQLKQNSQRHCSPEVALWLNFSLRAPSFSERFSSGTNYEVSNGYCRPQRPPGFGRPLFASNLRGRSKPGGRSGLWHGTKRSKRKPKRKITCFIGRENCHRHFPEFPFTRIIKTVHVQCHLCERILFASLHQNFLH